MPGNPCTLKPQGAKTLFSRNTFAVYVHKKFEHKTTNHKRLRKSSFLFKTRENSRDFQQQRVDAM